MFRDVNTSVFGVNQGLGLGICSVFTEQFFGGSLGLAVTNDYGRSSDTGAKPVTVITPGGLQAVWMMLGLPNAFKEHTVTTIP